MNERDASDEGDVEIVQEGLVHTSIRRLLLLSGGNRSTSWVLVGR